MAFSSINSRSPLSLTVAIRMPELTVIRERRARWQLSARSAAMRASSALAFFCNSASALRLASGRWTAALRGAGLAAAGSTVAAGAMGRPDLGRLTIAESGTEGGGG